MTSIQWILLHNFKNGWPFALGLTSHDASIAFLWAEEKGFVKDGNLTIEGHSFFDIHGHEKPMEVK